MTRTEFKQALSTYKTLNETIKEIVNKKFESGGWEYMNFNITNGRIFASIWSGEDPDMMPDATQQRDITQDVLTELTEDIIF